MKIIIYCFFIYSLSCCTSGRVSKNVPENILFGTATSGYQVEGAWDEDGKGENVFDHMVHTTPEIILDQSNGDVACDSYHKTEVDVAMLKSIGFQYYRFSISWTRILPNGVLGPVNEKGIAYYNELINQLLANDIHPLVTIYHFDLPQVLQDLGGWTNPKIVKWFTDYCNVVFSNFADRVKFWVTINEPNQICELSYENSIIPPGVKPDGFGEYLCIRHMLLAHATVYRLYKKKYENGANGRMGLALDSLWYEPRSNSTADIDAAERAMQFRFGIYAHPIFSRGGDFPDVVKKFVAERSAAEGFNKSRLPEFTSTEISLILGTGDFFGLNYYTSAYAEERTPDPIGAPSKVSDTRVSTYQSPLWLTGSIEGYKSVPWGFNKLLQYFKKSYGDPAIYITENGFPDDGELMDEKRLRYLREHIAAMLDAIHNEAVRVERYTVWSIMDNFEWIHGYGAPFGIFHVNFTDPNRPRTPKLTAKFFKDLIDTRKLIYEE